jgi:DNA repair exonuclease SbcCD ATPase subunit
MADYLHIPCPNCKHTLRVRRQYIGIEVTCQRCNRSFIVEAPPEDNVAEREASAANHEEYEKRIAGLQAELDELRKGQAQFIAAHESMIEQLTTDASNVAAARDQALDRVAALEEQLRTLSSRSDQSTSKKHQANEARIAGLQTELDELRKTHAASVASHETMNNELVKLNEERSAHILKLTSSLSQAEETFQQSEARIQQLAGDVSRQASARDQVQDRVTALEEKLQQSEERVQQLLADAARQVAAGDQAQEHTTLFEEKLQRSEERIRQLSDEVARSLAARDQAQEQVALLEEKLRALPAQTVPASGDGELPAKDNRIEKLEEELQQAQSELNAMRELIGGLGISIG